MYSFDSKVRFSEIDSNGNLNILGILNYFQDSSTLQSDELGIGMDKLHKDKMAWVLSTWQIDVFNYPRLSEKITVGTFPYEFRGFFGRRNFVMKNADGEVLAMADTLWTLIDLEEVKPVRATEEILNTYVLEEKLPMDYQKGRIHVPSELKKLEDIKVKAHNLDANNHVNNGQYIEMMLDEIENSYFKRLRVEYRKQAKLGDILTPYVYEDDSIIVGLFKDRSGDTTTVMEFTK